MLPLNEARLGLDIERLKYSGSDRHLQTSQPRRHPGEELDERGTASCRPEEHPLAWAELAR